MHTTGASYILSRNSMQVLLSVQSVQSVVNRLELRFRGGLSIPRSILQDSDFNHLWALINTD